MEKKCDKHMVDKRWVEKPPLANKASKKNWTPSRFGELLLFNLTWIIVIIYSRKINILLWPTCDCYNMQIMENVVHMCGYEEEDSKTCFIGKGVIKIVANAGMLHSKVNHQ